MVILCRAGLLTAYQTLGSNRGLSDYFQKPNVIENGVLTNLARRLRVNPNREKKGVLWSRFSSASAQKPRKTISFYNRPACMTFVTSLILPHPKIAVCGSGIFIMLVSVLIASFARCI